MTYKICEYCKKKFTKEDIRKSLPAVRQNIVDKIWKRRKYCSDECAQKYTIKNRKMIAITYDVDEMICDVGQMGDTYSDVIKKLLIYYNSEGKKRTGLHETTPKHQPSIRSIYNEKEKMTVRHLIEKGHSVSSQVKEFKDITGKSKATYFRIKQAMLFKDMLFKEKMKDNDIG